jgi:outer membrane protein assembly factor BamA
MMPRIPLGLPLLSLLIFSNFAFAQTQSTPSQAKISVESYSISGTTSIASAELADITNVFAGSTFNDDTEEMKERLRAELQDHGFFTAKVKKLDITAIDPLGSPKLVRIAAEIEEGERSHLSGIEFVGNRAISSEQLRAGFPIHVGSEFRRSKIASGIESLRTAYGHLGFLDEFAIPMTTFEGSMAKLRFELTEGPQYHMDTFEVVGPSEVSGRLQVKWELQPGSVFDAAYINDFLNQNSSLLPDKFSQHDDVVLLKDCPDAKVAVHIHLTEDPQHLAKDREKRIDCKQSETKKTAAARE